MGGALCRRHADRWLTPASRSGPASLGWRPLTADQRRPVPRLRTLRADHFTSRTRHVSSASWSPIDGSATSDRGLDEAIALARLTGGSIRLLHVLDELVFVTGFETGATYLDTVLPAPAATQRAHPRGGPRTRCRRRGRGRHADGRVLRATPLATSSSSRRRMAGRSHRHRHPRPARREPHAARQRRRAGRAHGTGAGAAGAAGRRRRRRPGRRGRRRPSSPRSARRRPESFGDRRAPAPRRALTPPIRSRAAACRSARAAAAARCAHWIRTGAGALFLQERRQDRSASLQRRRWLPCHARQC